ncbi:GNAT family N-acetyltransferase [Eubacteriales bacterium OttesenSCG-928-N14]|nr:GNAT family N-acetyltransferase [Eubacteriales bacterium OttesenSCG-928-N14]
MDIILKQIQRRDFTAARKFAIEGMHLDWYVSGGIEMYLYSKYFWYLEISRATRAIGAYVDDVLVGVLLVDMDKQPKVFRSLWYRLYVKLAAFIINIGYKDASSTYDQANKELLAAYKSRRETDGELNFFAVDPNIKGKELGTLLLNELEQLERGKHIYLFTDSGSTYQFYAHRGFDEVGRKDVTLKIHGKEVPLTCLLFSKTF